MKKTKNVILGTSIIIVSLILYYSALNFNLLGNCDDESKFTVYDQLKTLVSDYNLPIDKICSCGKYRTITLRKDLHGVTVVRQTSYFLHNEEDTAYGNAILIAVYTLILIVFLILGITYLTGEQEELMEKMNL